MRKPSNSEWMDVARLSRTDWRVSDTRIDGNHSDQIVGFIEKLARNRYEVLWMIEPLRWAYVDSLQIALDGFADPANPNVPILLAREQQLPIMR